MLKKSVRDFAKNVLSPGVVDRDEKEYYDPNTFKAMADLGLTGIPFEESWGELAWTLLLMQLRLKKYLVLIHPSVILCQATLVLDHIQ